MNFADKKTLLVIYILGGILSACTKRVDIKAPKQESEIVVNCLFNPDSVWKAYIGMSQLLPGKGSFQAVNNAAVLISSKDTAFTLNNMGNGEYTFIHERPQPGVSYRIEVKVPGHKPAYAVSRIPGKGNIVSSRFDTTTTYFTPDNGFDNIPGNRMELTLQSPSDTTCFYELLGYKYNVDNYTEFIINDRVLEKIRNYQYAAQYTGINKVPEVYIQQLAQLKGKRPVGQDSLFKLIKKYTHTDVWNFLVYALCKKIRHSPPVYNPERFGLVRLYSIGGKFYNITGDGHGVFGQVSKSNSSNLQKIKLFMRKIFYIEEIHNEFERDQVSEAWVSLYSLSKEMYQYQTSYLNQIINKQNPFAQPVQVYSNIHNGIGIFAGYQMGRVRIY